MCWLGRVGVAQPSKLCTKHTSLICVINIYEFCLSTETIAVELQLINLLNVNLNLTGVSLIWDMVQKQNEHKVTKNIMSFVATLSVL